MTQAATLTPVPKAGDSAPNRASPVPPTVCPGCGKLEMVELADHRLKCPGCSLVVEAIFFNPVEMLVPQAELALPEYAACINHPQKKATAVCAGTGSFICPLCAVELKGKTYSVQYLDSEAGKQQTDELAPRYLQRPDRKVPGVLLVLLIPYVDAFIFLPFPLWAIYCYVQSAAAFKMRRENRIYAQLVGRGSIISGIVIVSIVLVLWLVMAIAMGFVMYQRLHVGKAVHS